MGKRINCFYDKFVFFLAGVCFTICLGVSAVEASTINVQVQVDSHAGPWDPILNSGYDYGVHDHVSPTLIDEALGFDFSSGNTLTIMYLNGTVSTCLGWPWVDAVGDTNHVANDNGGSSGKGFPSKYMSVDWDTYLMALVGTFTDSGGVIVGTPFEIGNGPTNVIIPLGAAQLQLGVNDDVFGDNSGSFNVIVKDTPVPIPGAMWLLGSGLVSFAALRRKLKQYRLPT